MKFENIDTFMKEYLANFKDKRLDVHFFEMQSPPQEYPDYI